MKYRSAEERKDIVGEGRGSEEALIRMRWAGELSADQETERELEVNLLACRAFVMGTLSAAAVKQALRMEYP